MEHKEISYVKGGSAIDFTYSLRGMDFPADKSALIDHARKQSANEEVLDRLDKIEDRVYDNIADVTKQVGNAKQVGKAKQAGKAA
ncbi:MAG: DUF2795 domain-containing protein [Deltaproteobacteria bacterium]|nr:DUF2795 domain-containing protein [Deltaproteobacteria bacterium]